MFHISGNGWIWTKDWSESDNAEPAIVYFRKTIKFAELPKEMLVKVSADSRYKLYVNGSLIEVGPLKGDRQVWYYDELDLVPYLKQGTNVFAAIVLRYPTIHGKGSHSIFRTETPGFYLKGYVNNQYDIACRQEFMADGTWRTKRAKNIKIISENPFFAPLQILEKASGDDGAFRFMDEEFEDDTWGEAMEYNDFTIPKAVSPGNLTARSIPYLYRTKRNFNEVYCIRKSIFPKNSWESMLCGESAVTIPAHSNEVIEISAGEETTGFLTLILAKGKAADIKILTSECYAYDSPDQGNIMRLPKKGDRTDCKDGTLFGFVDEYEVLGAGTEQRPEIYEPFWFRTFRFIQLEISTREEPLTIQGFHYTETGYPIEMKTQVKTSDRSLEGVWDISARTLKRCMHETYEDCPFYEQLQYAMDSRNQILYTYAVSADDRLARKCMDDFRRSQRYDGMINCSYPCYGPNIIPGFSIYYIGMVYDHMMYFGDRELVRAHMPAIWGILNYFDNSINEMGLVGKTGGLNIKDRYWSFIDWTKEWNETSGVPRATLQGPITMESLLYILGLTYASGLAAFIGETGLSEGFRERACRIREAVNKYCRGSSGMYQDGPGVEEYSQHCQVFAVLTDTVAIGEGKKYLLETLEHTEAYAQCSVAMMFYLYRAIEKCGVYEKTDELWNTWRVMVSKNLTTCEEDPVNSRSDCHAWGALALYELPSAVLGVKPSKPGYEAVLIAPAVGYFQWAEGDVITPKGMIHVKWNVAGGERLLKVAVPDSVKMELVFPKELEGWDITVNGEPAKK
ncbi:MAG TPA: hypothetical protein GXX75_15500 [Clostridiales bacterium]|nr:hypothetical protein [Clostridiales bacterium]